MKQFLKSVFPLFLLLLPALFLSACDSGPTGAKKDEAAASKTAAATIPDQVLLAEIDGQPVTGADLKEYLGLFKGEQARLPEKLENRLQLVQHLVDRKLLLEAAEKAGYAKLDELKKHGSLNPSERETIILRAFLTDKISRPATPDDAELAAYREKHPGLDPKKAREALAAAKQKQLFRQLMAELRKGRKIVIQQENLARLPSF